MRCLPYIILFISYLLFNTVNAKELTAAITSIKQHFTFKTIKHEKLAQIGAVSAIVQDHQGFLWLGGSGGLAHYDGYEFTLYKHDPKDVNSLSNNGINDMVIDATGQLWIATSSGLSLFIAKKEQFQHFFAEDKFANTPRHNWLWSLLETQQGDIFVGTGGGLKILDKKTSQLVQNELYDVTFKGETPYTITTLIEDKNNNIWAGTMKNGVLLFERQKQSFQHFKHKANTPQSLSNDQIHNIFEDSQNRIWIGTNNGLNRYKAKENTFIPYTLLTDKHSVAHKVIRRIFEDKTGNIWLGTDGKGLSLYQDDKDIFVNFTKSDTQNTGLKNNKIRTLFEDNSGLIWIGHYPSGTSIIDPYASAFQNNQYNPLDKNTIGHNDILSSAEDKQGNIWLGTEKGLNYINRSSGEITRFNANATDPHSLAADSVLSLFNDDENKLWIGTWSGGLSVKNSDSSQFKHFKSLGNLQVKEVWSLYQDEERYIWVGSEKGLSRYDKQQDSFEHFLHNPKNETSIFDGPVLSIFEDSKKRFWLGGYWGVSILDRQNKTFKHYRPNSKKSNAISDSFVKAITEDSQGNVWISTGNGGVNKFNNTQSGFEHIKKQQGLADNLVGCTLVDQNGDMWFGTGKGINKYTVSDKRFLVYTQQQGLAGDTYKSPNCLKTQYGELLFGSTNGLTIFHPDKIISNNFIPPVSVTDFQIFNSSVNFKQQDAVLNTPIKHTNKISLDYFHSVFSFKFAALNYYLPEKNEYAYQLVGFDKKWVYSGKRRETTYTNLDAGNYIFRVKASNNEGVWNDKGTELEISILPPPWLTWWAYTLYILSFIAIVSRLVYSQYRKRQIVIEQNKILEIRVQERTSELSKKNQDIQAMLGNMRQGLFTINKLGLIHPEYSKHLEDIFETSNIPNNQALDFLFAKADVSSDIRNQVSEAINVIIGEDEFNYELNSHLLINEYQAAFKQQQKILSLDWNPIFIDGDVIKLMVSVRDITQLRKAEYEALAQKRELEIVGQLISITQKKYHAFIKSSYEFIQENRKAIENAHDSLDLDLLFRNMHTLKGNSRTYNFIYLADIVHTTEDYYSTLKINTQLEPDTRRLINDLDEVETALKEYENVFNHVLHKNSQTTISEDASKLTEPQIQSLHSIILKTLEQETDSNTIKTLLSPAKAMLTEAVSSPLPLVLQDIVSSLNSIAEQLNKAVPKICYKGEELKILNAHHDLLQNVFAHILKNSLDHGIEAPEQRLKNNKPEAGTIIIKTVKADNNTMTLAISDDGQGINIPALKNKGHELNLWKENENINLNDIAQTIFASGLSTKKEVSDISGRGVGMDAVKQYLNKNGANIQAKITDPAPNDKVFVQFKLVLTLPKSLYI